MEKRIEKAPLINTSHNDANISYAMHKTKVFIFIFIALS